MRRLIASILAILVLVLSCIPCDDAGAAAHSTGSVTQVAEKSRNGSCPVEGHADHCSPFCACACCTGATLPQVLGVPVAPVIEWQSPVYAAHLPVRIQRLAFAVWQPPQLG